MSLKGPLKCCYSMSPVLIVNTRKTVDDHVSKSIQVLRRDSLQTSVETCMISLSCLSWYSRSGFSPLGMVIPVIPSRSARTILIKGTIMYHANIFCKLCFDDPRQKKIPLFVIRIDEYPIWVDFYMPHVCGKYMVTTGVPCP